ncbi:DUF5050 domain-containing protein [Clostridium pasteurianum]|uniref:DUF5050 domain-containing protein n=1 Tax=Clostridium pasteurianum TaxID=1501 RepID=UPI002260952C|nr:DUF5050 domain-containing protein [Clostridium pasteurianum]UZW14317.1 DUF5050 domain-containing protein [Clostridium pasteurianum]
MYCTKCGTKNPEDAKYCYECGVKLKNNNIVKDNYEVINNKIIKIYKSNENNRESKNIGAISKINEINNKTKRPEKSSLIHKLYKIKLLPVNIMYKPSIIGIIIILAIILFLTYTVSYKLLVNNKSNNTEKVSIKSENLIDKAGNLPSNIINGGIISESNNWIYYNDSDGLYKMRSDGSSVINICNDNANYINVVGDYIYYVNVSDGNSIYKIKNDGTSRERILSTYAKSINILGDWIYYCKSTENGLNFRLYKIKKDGTNNVKLIDDSIIDGNFTIVNNLMYYKINSQDGGESLYSSKLDGSQQHKLCDNVDQFNINEKNIYYYTSINNNGLFKINLDGSNKVKLSDDVIDSINMSKDNIYYTVDQHINKILYSIDLNGKNKIKLSEANDFINLNTSKNLLFYMDNTSDNYSIKSIDISNISKVDDPQNKIDIKEKNGDFILPNSNTTKLKEEDLKNLTKDQLILARNELFARHGYIFNTPEFKEYFESKTWYHPNSSFNGELKDNIEKYNFNLIKKIEDSK